jgi:fatty-acyl-CoA synthase
MNVPLTPVRFLRYAEQQFSCKTAVVCGDQRFTYAELSDRAARLAGALRESGVNPGDRVAFLSVNCHRLLEAYYGVIAAGTVLLPLNFRLSPDELVYILNDSEATILFLQQEFLPLVESFRQKLSTAKKLVLLDAPSRADWLPAANYDDMLSAATPYFPDIMQFDENSMAELFYTSGTSAHPKGVMLTHRNIYLHALSTSLNFRTTPETVQLHTIPLFHANGWGAAHSLTFAGGTHVMIPRFVCSEVFRLIECERVNSMNLVPTMATALVNSPDREKYDLSSLDCVHIGGAASSPTLIRQVEEKIGCPCYASYGLTETAPVLSTARPKLGTQLEDDARHVFQSMTGYAIPGVEVRVVDSDGNDVPRDGKTMGEAIARGDGVMAGYWKQPDATAEVLRDGWLHTGDIAVVNEQGSFLIVDRQKDMIISGGENISSLEVEKVILAHPGVYETAVIPIPDEKWGEVPKALVVLKPEARLSEAELIDFCRSHLAHYKCPRSVEFVPALPKTATGKILKKDLRRKYQTSGSPDRLL